MAPKYDLLLTGGEVIDPSQDLRGVRDVAFKDGMVASVEVTKITVSPTPASTVSSATT